MDFEDQLQHAIHRGKARGEVRRQAAAREALSEEELKRLYNHYRLQLSEQIEQCLRRLPHHFPGFSCETIYGERGWGAACSRDDIRMEPGGRRNNDFSRIEMTIRPLSTYQVLELAAKGTIRNKEVFNRNYFEKLQEADPEKFSELVNIWVLEYAELFATKS